MPEQQNKVQLMQQFIASCPFISDFTGNIHVDFTSDTVEDYGLCPIGQEIISRVPDICGGVKLTKQISFGLFCRRFTLDDFTRLDNAGFLDNLSNWIEAQSINGEAPTFGDVQEEETIEVRNGELLETDETGGTGLYQIQIAVVYTKIYEL